MNVSTFGPPIQPGATQLTHAARTELDRHRLGRGLDRGLRRRVAALERADLAHAHRDDEHDRRVAVLRGRGLEVREARLGEAERAPHVDLEDLAPLHEVDRFERLHHVHPEGVVDEHVEAAEGLDGAGDERLDLLGLHEVGRHGQRPAAVGLDAPPAPRPGSRRCGPPARPWRPPGPAPGRSPAPAPARLRTRSRPCPRAASRPLCVRRKRPQAPRLPTKPSQRHHMVAQSIARTPSRSTHQSDRVGWCRFGQAWATIGPDIFGRAR